MKKILIAMLFLVSVVVACKPNPADMLALKALQQYWYADSIVQRDIDNATWAPQKQQGLDELARLQSAYDTDAEEGLADAMSGYIYQEDYIRYSPEPWKVALVQSLGMGEDCNGSAWLTAYITGAKIYVILRLENGKPVDYENWHFISQTPDGHIFSNFRLVADAGTDISDYVHKHYDWANYLVLASYDLNSFTVIN